MVYFILILVLFIILYIYCKVRNPLRIISRDNISQIKKFINFRIKYQESADAVQSLEWLDEDTSWRTSSTEKYYAKYGYPISDVFMNDNYIYSPLIESINDTKQIMCVDEVDIPNFLFIKLGNTAKSFIKQGNAGGNSILSEAYSIDYFERYLSGTDFIFENDICYWMDTVSMVDFITTIDNIRVGVSVTRALNYYEPDHFTTEMARKLLIKKLHGLLVARNAVNAEQVFYCSLLHIWAQNEIVAKALRDAYNEINIDKLGPSVVGNVGIIISVSDNWTIYGNLRGMLAYLVKF